jgi:hypothetical protein
MLSRLLARHEAERPFLIIGVAGSLLALASFFWGPLIYDGGTGSSAWNLWQQSLAPRQGSGIAFLLVTAFFASTCVTLLIGCAVLIRPLPHFLAGVYTLAMLAGMGVFGFSLCATFPYFVFSWGSLGMGLGYLGILFGHYAFAQG